MSVFTSTRKITFNEAVEEMDRRGRVIENLERKISIADEAFRDIDAVACDFGHFEDAARTMKEIANKASNAFDRN